ncbi:hypothetical protein Aspvir_007922 [Aspergillus viridinutans]|uniref:DUF7730 domain-containing protein n=1 Tax=Aspergillus viridinutans TaxID=75553 RepID=A0A9P3BXK8_ASPVI|nr:uncharacterized protein Aspvir_007922 [Aspergillus viridinutans]GIK03847.1 hypothetical protein Aspvir_007922 [Aspergillus viridinutans]
MTDGNVFVWMMRTAKNTAKTTIVYVLVLPMFVGAAWTAWGVMKILKLIKRYNPKSILDRRRRRANWELEPFTRPRALTNPLKGIVTQRNFSQLQSNLFKLPLDIRQRIYRESVEHTRTIHVWRTNRRLCSIYCVAANPGRMDGNVVHWRCSPPLDQNGLVVAPFPRKWLSYRFQGLLCSCRRIYSEALDTLYGSNVLYFDDPYNLHKLSESVPPQRLASIRLVHIEVLAFHNGQGLSQVLANWKKACIVLVWMTGLQRLHVALGADHPETDTPSPRVGPFLEILRKVKAPEFLVEIPSNATLDESGRMENGRKEVITMILGFDRQV